MEECEYHCAGQSMPDHLCDPMVDSNATAEKRERRAPDQGQSAHAEHRPHEAAMRSPQEAMGHGGHAGMSMDAMVRDMRNRFLVAALLSIPIVLWSPIGRDVLNFDVAAPFGLRDDVWLLLLSLPVVFYASWIFFDGAVRALRARTLD